MSDLNAPGMAAALDEDAAFLAAMGADPGPSFGTGGHMDDDHKHAALIVHPLFLLGWERALEAAAGLLERDARQDRDENGRWQDRRSNEMRDDYAEAIRALKPD